jgi:NAD(P)H-dependent FMN reductase
MIFSVIYGSVRSARQGIKGAKFLCNQLTERGHEVQLIDAAAFQLPLLDKMYKEYDEKEAPEHLRTISTMLQRSDAFVLVSGEYNHSIPPALKNLLDHFQKEFFFKACGIVTYSAGPFGGVRAAVHLRAIVGELGMVSNPIMFPISAVGKAFDDEGKALDDAYPRRVARFLTELEWYAEALNVKRTEGVPY